jgi:TolB-like protein/AraC-like DNA-binding protein/Flp pilus assembly protein TadD
MTEHPAKDQLFIRKLTEITLANLGNEKFGIKEIAIELGLSHRSINRRLKSLISKTVSQFIRETRLQKALEMLQKEEVTAAEAGYKVGFSSPTYFSACFHEFFGYPPGKVKKADHDIADETDIVQVTANQEKERPVRWHFILISSLFFAILVFLVYYFFIKDTSANSGIPVKELEKSIAVLPFKNLSDTLANQYFIDGLMEEILTNLSRIQDLRVISRTSVDQFRGSNKSASEIAKKLDVNYIVEGSGQKYGNTFRLRVQLIKAKGKEAHLWAESYEQEIRETKDIFKIQSQVALAIAKELKAGITATEEDLIQQAPTNNSLAYDYYLRGKKFIYDLKWDTAIIMFGKAVELDPGFVSAYLERATLYTKSYFSKGNNTSGYFKGFDDLAKADLEIALKINANSPEVKLEQAGQLFMLDRNHDKALALLDEINYQMRNNASFFSLRGNILRRTGEWEESLKEMHKAILLDPLNVLYYSEIGFTYMLMRRYPEAKEFFNKPRLLDLFFVNQMGNFLNIIYWKGDLQEALKICGLSISELESGETRDSSINNYFYFDMDFNNNYFFYNRQFKKLISIANGFEDQFKYIPKTLNLAHLYFLNANLPLSRKYADSAITELNLKVNESPEDERYYSSLGYAYAFKGEKREAIKNAQKAVKLKPLKLDAWQGFVKEMDLAKIYVLRGEYDLAMNIIERLLTIPGELSVPQLNIDPDYDKLRSLPRFQKILTTEYETKY